MCNDIFSIGPPPVLPGCMGPLFPADRETVNVGCPICIPQGTYVNLDCGVMSENTTEIEYSWERDNVTVSTARILQVRFEGSYTCTATNLDGMDSATTDVYCKLCVCVCVYAYCMLEVMYMLFFGPQSALKSPSPHPLRLCMTPR